MYIFFNNNPKGLKIGDCVVRAISAALDQPWERTYVGLCVEGFMFRDMPNANAVWASYLHSKGFKRRSLPDNCPECYTDTEFARAISGVSAAPVWEIMDELMTVLQAIKPGLYEGVLRKIREIS